MEWLTANWFQIITLACLLLSWAVHYGITTQKWQSLRDEFKEFKKVVTDKMQHLEDKLDEVETGLSGKIATVEHTLALHTSNSELHVSPTLLQLFNERSDYVKKQFDDTRADIQRIEGLLTK